MGNKDSREYFSAVIGAHRFLESLIIICSILGSSGAGLFGGLARMSNTAPASLDTVLNADAVEFCPVEGQRDRLVCGTYQLEESEEGGRAEQQTRHGRLLVVRSRQAADGSVQLEEESRLDVPGVFDIKWGGWAMGKNPMLGHAAADGHLYTYTLGDKGDLTQVHKVDCRQEDAAPGTLALSLDWSDRRRQFWSGGVGGGGGSSSSQVAVSMSDGTVCIVESGEAGDLIVKNQWNAHDLEAWIVTWDSHSPEGSVLYSGADDGILKVWDLRAGTDAPMARCSRFDAGVTCMQSHAQREHCLAVGSYDESVSIFDTRSFKAPAARCNVGGGVWRLKWNSKQPQLLLAACMHAGFTVLKYDHSRACFDEDSAFPFTGGHKSLGYGADWREEEPGEEEASRIVGTASFYDHLLEACRVPSSLFEEE